MKELELLEQELALEKELFKIEAREDYAKFVLFTKPDYSMQPFHRGIARHLQMFAEGKVKKMLLCAPPQHGKSQLSTRQFPAYLLGQNPKLKIAVASYSATMASSFNRDIQRIIDTDLYREIFPDTLLNASNVSTDARKGVLRNSEIFEIVDHRGFVKTVGRGGALTGTPVDIGIIDDPLKDREEAQSETIREALWSWYTDVFESRFHNDSQQLIMLTRWHEDDLAGRVIKRDGLYSEENPNGWVMVKYKAIKEGPPTSEDSRQEGEALWPQKHSLERLRQIEKNSPITFNSLYQQDPKPSKEALVFPVWREIDKFPEHLIPFYGLDFGFTNDPSALIKCAIEGRKLYLEQILYSTGLTNSDIYNAIKDMVRNSLVICDSAEPKSITELQRMGLNARGSIKGPGSVNAGINKVKEFEIIVVGHSPDLKRELNSYQWIMNGGVATNTPAPGNDHCPDAFRGAAFTVTYKPKGIKTLN